MEKKPGKVKYYLLKKRFLEFWSIYKSSKKGILGIVIIVFFVFLATFGPLLSPYDPLSDTYVGGARAPPTWIKFFPGYGDLSENYNPMKDPFFTSEVGLSEWRVAKSPEGDYLKVYFAADTGYDVGSGPGSLGIKFEGVPSSAEEYELTLTKTFNYPYKTPPSRFAFPLHVLVKNRGDTTIKVMVTIENPEGKVFTLWKKELYDENVWIEPKPNIDSYNSGWVIAVFKNILVNAPKRIFSKSGEYVYSIKFSFKADDPSKLLNLRVYIDDVDVMLYGKCFGLLGTDHLGRDLFSQLVSGAKVSLFVGLLSAFLSVFIGLIVGLFAGYIGKAVDEILMRFADMLLVLPFLPLMLVLIVILGQSIWNIVLVISLLGWMGFSRIIRSQVLSLKERPFVEAAKAAGASQTYIIVHHILPNVMSLVYVSLATAVPNAILLEAALSFLGLGDPTVVSWGLMLHNVQEQAAITEWFWVIPPGLCIALLSMSFIMIGYAIDEILNPKLRRR